MLAVGVRGGCLDIVCPLYRFCSFRLSPTDGSIKTEIQPERTVKPKTTNQHSLSASECTSTYVYAFVLFNLFMRWAWAGSGEPALSGDRFSSYKAQIKVL